MCLFSIWLSSYGDADLPQETSESKLNNDPLDLGLEKKQGSSPSKLKEGEDLDELRMLVEERVNGYDENAAKEEA